MTADLHSAGVQFMPNDFFLTGRSEFAAWAGSQKSLLMENFYRWQRSRLRILMDEGQPMGGQWNFDKENRKQASPDLFLPKPLLFSPDKITQEVIALVKKRFGNNFGDLEPFWFAVTKEIGRAHV